MKTVLQTEHLKETLKFWNRIHTHDPSDTQWCSALPTAPRKPKYTYIWTADERINK